jgi:hypothetical protein
MRSGVGSGRVAVLVDKSTQDFDPFARPGLPVAAAFRELAPAI